ncbi:hypothetical protein BHE74_00055436 [Ensete ventricosum]|nr:hypothetical protein GW17_00052721 [Ensete ventricosum]RWW39250.1 hypothetical protein BHE74_00055436 [Ensete ventricosum]RZS09820.1 hypothetical protein BHM03_00040950 [Ensete ventricosum]
MGYRVAACMRLVSKGKHRCIGLVGRRRFRFEIPTAYCEEHAQQCIALVVTRISHGLSCRRMHATVFKGEAQMQCLGGKETISV